jgi:pimeloyl-ACP methyl ester carboxylesterase
VPEAQTATCEERAITLPTGEVNVRVGGSGAPLVILHRDTGSPGWLPFHGLLARDFTVYAPDLPGFGRSARLEWAAKPSDLAVIVQHTLDALDLDELVLVGLGFGGWLAAEMAVTAQRRFKRLVLAAPMGIRPVQSYYFDQMMADFTEYVRLGFAQPEAFAKAFGDPPSQEQVQIWDFAREAIARIAWKPYMFSNELPFKLQNLTVPTTIVYGSEDQLVPREVVDLYAEAIRGARLLTLAGAGHYVEYEQPNELAQVVRGGGATGSEAASIGQPQPAGR